MMIDGGYCFVMDYLQNNFSIHHLFDYIILSIKIYAICIRVLLTNISANATHVENQTYLKIKRGTLHV